MNVSRAIASLESLAKSAGDLADVCEREAPEFSDTWRSISTAANALSTEPSSDGISSLLSAVWNMFAYHPGAFSEVYIIRKEPAERTIGPDSGKRLLREIVAPLLPRGIVTAPTRPLQTPQRGWLRGPLRLLDPVLDRGFRTVGDRAAAGLARALAR